MEKKGLFFCIEGLDGCGKTTQTKLLVKRLRKKGYDTVYTAEPSDGNIGRFIKKYCLHGKKRVSDVIEALLFAADRFDHVDSTIIPALNEGKLVFSDRYVYSSLAYQGAYGLDLKWIKKTNKFAMSPDLAIFIDVDPEIVFQRLKRKKSTMEILETQRRVRKVYMKYVKNGELVKVDGTKSKKEVSEKILTLVFNFLDCINYET